MMYDHDMNQGIGESDDDDDDDDDDFMAGNRTGHRVAAGEPLAGKTLMRGIRMSGRDDEDNRHE